MRAVTIGALGCLFGVTLMGCPPGKIDAGSDDFEGPIPRAVACTLVTRTPAWSGPYLVKQWPNDGQALPCPGRPITAEKSWDWYADLDPSPVCAPCVCAPSTGTCGLSSKLTAHDVSCQDLAQNHKDFSFDAPPAWDGMCDSSMQIPAGVAKSVTIEAIGVKDESCAPLDTGIARSGVPQARTVPQSAWRSLVRVCDGWDWIPQENPESWCIPDAPPPPDGYKLCIIHDGEVPSCNNP